MYLLFDIKDLLQLINDNLEDIQLYLVNYCEKQYNFIIKLTYLNTFSKNYDQKEIMKDKYKYIKKLDISNNKFIKDINHMKKLKELEASYNCEIDDKSIKKLNNLKKLNASNNKKITNINHMTKLEELNASWNCGIDDNGIKNLVNLKVLNACDNEKITDINHLIKLEELDASFNCGIDDNGIKNLINLKKIKKFINHKILKKNLFINPNT